MRKLKIYGVKKSNRHNVFYIQKDKSFLEPFREFLHSLGFKQFDTAKELLKLTGDADNNYSVKGYSNKLYQDRYFYLENKKYKFDVFFGKERIIVSIFASFDAQKELIEGIMKFCKL